MALLRGSVATEQRKGKDKRKVCDILLSTFWLAVDFYCYTIESPEATPSQSKFRRTTKSGERKSARLRVSGEEDVSLPFVSAEPALALGKQLLDDEKVGDVKAKESRGDNLMNRHEE